MSDKIKTDAIDLSDSVEDMAKAAVEIEKAAKKNAANLNKYTHVFKKPFVYEGVTYESLTFDWASLTGKDDLEIETEVNKAGKTLTVRAYTGTYLTAMAARACTFRDEEGKRCVSSFTIQAMPITEAIKIKNKARDFLLLLGL